MTPEESRGCRTNSFAMLAEGSGRSGRGWGSRRSRRPSAWEITVRALAYIEAGARNLTLRAMAQIAAVLGVRTTELLVPPEDDREVRKGRPRKS